MLKENKIFLLLVAAILLLIVFLIPKLTVMSLWHDESFSALLVQYDLKEMLYRISLDVHPPLYYLLLKLWVFFSSSSLLSLRLFSFFFGILTILATYFFAKEALLNKKIAFLSALLLTFSSFQIQYHMEARMYTLGAFLIVLSSYLLVKAIKTKGFFFWLAYALTVICAIYTHYYTFFWLAAQALFLFLSVLKEPRENIKELLLKKNLVLGAGAASLIIISYIPWIKIFLKQLSQVQETYWIPSMNIWSMPNTFLSMTTGGSTNPSQTWPLLAFITLTVLAAAIYFILKISSFNKWLIVFLLFAPFLGSFLLSLKTSIYLDRYFIFALPFYLILISGAVLSLKLNILKNILIFIFLLGTLLSFPLRWMEFKIDKKPGMAAAAVYLNQEAKKKDKIFVGSSFVFFTFKYYNKTGISPLLYVQGDLPHFSGTALLSPQNLVSDFNKAAQKNDVVWVINTTGFGNYQPVLPQNWQKLEEKGYEDAYDYRGWIVVSKYEVK